MRRDREDHRLWSIVAATVRPFPGRGARPPVPGAAAEATRTSPGAVDSAPAPSLPSSTAPGKRAHRAPDPIEPNRRHLIARDRPPGARVDLHGLDQDRARAVLTAFVLRAHAEGERTVLVITGKGARGDGVLRRHTPDWLAQAPLRAVVAGLSEAHRKHGGEGALYVALKRRQR